MSEVTGERLGELCNLYTHMILMSFLESKSNFKQLSYFSFYSDRREVG